ncbi:high affinity immunoglobulin gamma Fc receptor I-like [Anomaloglossus baeobatrachus]
MMDGRKRSYFFCLLASLLNIRGLGAEVRPVIIFKSNWSEILFQDPVTLLCDVGSAALENQRYYWYKDGEPLKVKDQQRLDIDSVYKEDVGDYQCGISNGVLSPRVTLNASTNFLILQRPPVIYDGDPLTLRCHGFYEGINTTFYKEDKEIKFSVNDSELHIDRVVRGSSGMYRCTKLLREPYHTYHMYSAETYISELELFSFPEIIVPSYRMLGHELTLTCISRLNPLRRGKELPITFYRNGQNVQQLRSVDTYTIQSARMEDSGNYTCAVSTGSGLTRKISNISYVHIQDYTNQNIMRLVLSGLTLMVAACFLLYHKESQHATSLDAK